jgi:hypothetical protein
MLAEIGMNPALARVKEQPRRTRQTDHKASKQATVIHDAEPKVSAYERYNALSINAIIKGRLNAFQGRSGRSGLGELTHLSVPR